MKGAVKYKRGLAMCKKRAAQIKPTRAAEGLLTQGLLSSEKSDDAPIKVHYSILGEDAGVIMCVGRITHQLIREQNKMQ